MMIEKSRSKLTHHLIVHYFIQAVTKCTEISAIKRRAEKTTAAELTSNLKDKNGKIFRQVHLYIQ